MVSNRCDSDINMAIFLPILFPMHVYMHDWSFFVFQRPCMKHQVKLTVGQHIGQEIVGIEIVFINLRWLPPKAVWVGSLFGKLGQMGELESQVRCINLSKMKSLLFSICFTPSHYSFRMRSSKEDGSSKISKVVIFKMVFLLWLFHH